MKKRVRDFGACQLEACQAPLLEETPEGLCPLHRPEQAKRLRRVGLGSLGSHVSVLTRVILNAFLSLGIFVIVDVRVHFLCSPSVPRRPAPGS